MNCDMHCDTTTPVPRCSFVFRHCDETLVLDWYFFGVIDHE
jgi:hypothetical protein